VLEVQSIASQEPSSNLIRLRRSIQTQLIFH
jgi:hypothetical protein